MLTPISLRLMFESPDNSLVPQHFQSLIETGIWRRLEEEKQARDLGLRPKVPKVEAEGSDPVKMDGSILTLFIMWSIVLSLTVLCLVIETAIVWTKRAYIVVAEYCNFNIRLPKLSNRKKGK